MSPALCIRYFEYDDNNLSIVIEASVNFITADVTINDINKVDKSILFFVWINSIFGNNVKWNPNQSINYELFSLTSVTLTSTVSTCCRNFCVFGASLTSIFWR